MYAYAFHRVTSAATSSEVGPEMGSIKIVFCHTTTPHTMCRYHGKTKVHSPSLNVTVHDTHGDLWPPKVTKILLRQIRLIRRQILLFRLALIDPRSARRRLPRSLHSQLARIEAPGILHMFIPLLWKQN